jgi:S1-C subfamily serine protease
MTQIVYFTDPEDISKIKNQIGNIPNEVNTLKIQSPYFTGSFINSNNNYFRSVNIFNSLNISTGCNIETYSDIIMKEGSLSTSSITGAVINQIKTIVKTYTDSSTLYENSIDKIVSISIRSNNGSYYVGSGFMITGPNPSTYGYILTAAHVIGDPNLSGNPVCSDIWINTTYPSNIIYKINGITNVVMGYDKIADVALIRLQSAGFNKVFNIKDSRTELKIGDVINTIGYPGGTDNQSISRGIVRDNKSQLEGYVMESVITDISIYGGNSGGPLITDDGKVVGIVSYGYTNEEEINGGVSSYLFKPIVNYFINNFTGSVVNYPKGYLGISYTSVNIVRATIFGMTGVEGYYVTGLDGSISPANFNVNDVITEIEGVRLGIMNNQYPLFTEVHLRPPGTVVNVKYRPNGGNELSKNVTLSSFNNTYDYLFSNYHRQPVKN